MGKTKKEIFDAYPEIEIYLKKIINEFNPEKVILFGSKATGVADSTSDSDFAIVTEQPFDENAIIGALDIMNYHKVDDHLKKEIDKEGVVLYDKKSKKVSG